MYFLFLYRYSVVKNLLRFHKRYFSYYLYIFLSFFFTLFSFFTSFMARPFLIENRRHLKMVSLFSLSFSLFIHNIYYKSKNFENKKKKKIKINKQTKKKNNYKMEFIYFLIGDFYNIEMI